MLALSGLYARMALVVQRVWQWVCLYSVHAHTATLDRVLAGQLYEALLL